MTSQYNIINPFLIKESFNKYTDSSAFSNYEKIAKDYYKLYSKLSKKLNNISGDQLRNKVKTWFFNLSLESRIKICTVENELFSTIIYQMYLRTINNKCIEFIPKSELTEIFEYKSDNIYKEFIEEMSSNEFTLENYYNSKSDTFFSYVNDYRMMKGGIYGEEERDKKYNSNIIDFITNEIKFYSVHHKPYPDCFCLSPCFLLNKEKFDTTFVFLGNIDYFKNLIEPIYNQEKNIYSYHLPKWFNRELSNYSITKYILLFIEQAIMIKYFLNNYFITKKTGNKNNKNEIIISLINDENLNRIFIDRKTVINYFNINYNDTNKKKTLLNETNIEKIFDDILINNEINNKIIFYKNFRRSDNYNNSRTAMLIQPLLEVNNSNNYIYNPIYDDMRLFLQTNQLEQNNYVKNKIRNNIIKVIEHSDSVTFTDYLLYQNVVNLWENEYFVYFEIIEHFINFFNEQNYKELLEEEKTTKKKKRKKNKKKQNEEDIDNNINNNINIINNNINNEIKEDNKNKENKDNINIDMECYKELFKDDEEKILYVPYYLSVNLDLKKKFKNIKDNKLKSIAKKYKKQDIKEIYNYIKNEFLLTYIINKVIHVQPDNYVKFFDNKEIISQNNTNEKKYPKIKGLKLYKKSEKKTKEDLGFITINFNWNDKDDNKNKNEIKLNSEQKEELIIDDNNNKETKEIKIKGEKIIEKNNLRNIKEINIPKTTIDKDNNNKNKSEIINSNNNNIKNNNNIYMRENTTKINQIKLSLNENQNQNQNLRSNSIKNKNHSRNNSTQKKKQKKENIFFLFDTVKNKPKNKNKSKSPNTPKKSNNVSNSLNIKILKIKKEEKNNLSFYEKLHNNILKNEKKVNIILQHLSIYKNYCIDEIKKIINKTYENNFINYSVDLYGSYTTGLMIEASDIDIRIKLSYIVKDEFIKYFNNLYEKLISIKKFEKIIPISTASVPVIKLIIDIEKMVNNDEKLSSEFSKFKQQNFFKNYIFDKSELTQIRVDITFIVNYKTQNFKEIDSNREIMNKIENDRLNKDNLENKEISNVIYIKEQLEIFPEIKPILILLKRYFYVKNMNSSFEGGLSSYNLFLLILSYAKYSNITQNKIINLGSFLIQFLQFFGKYFDFKSFTVNVNSPYIYEINNFINYNSGKSLIILDPLTGLNASKSSYKINEIQNMFLNSYNFFEKERINYEEEMYNENNDKRDNDKNHKEFEGILGLKKIHKNEYSKKNQKDKSNVNIIEKFFFSEHIKLNE